MRTNQSCWRHLRIILVLLATVSIAGITGCATFGPKYGSTKKDIVPLSKETGFDSHGQGVNAKNYYCSVIRDGSVQIRISFYYDASKSKISNLQESRISLVPYAGMTWASDKTITVSKSDKTFTFKDKSGRSINGKIDDTGKVIEGTLLYDNFSFMLSNSFTLPA